MTPTSRRAPRETGLDRQQQREKVLAMMQKPKRSKYRAIRCEVDGEKFDSKREMRRWLELKSIEKAGRLVNLQRQQRFGLTAANATGKTLIAHLVGFYVADFTYYNNDGFIVEDVKGGNATKTALYRWKKKHFEAQYGRTILET